MELYWMELRMELYWMELTYEELKRELYWMELTYEELRLELYWMEQEKNMFLGVWVGKREKESSLCTTVQLYNCTAPRK